ncbi:UDP-N-acetylmuramoyl-L-alanyl-D-glutamate--2,6-diaminopimelate ligase [Rivibacter subsaxonicus]|uniref:UDP-N-acetylmuramoyl-L-alanyl-D-glutamate--2,6-diaminopimelate ligase n=1 Tax=Rivibacter subsaxonicus TaxID=457575 RepID=A0A4Q7VG08_9BURK|nr:UDP-N-acetylmuramoyl-L-alanyl-D-glutamate--2,6-diaminopimelate ligase [Rivibacter subsaxonicus]RZT94942.1 UDP-N-acetylmuramoylalanyl-D-glutamate--2,6-diaminopimelate ligase [Rivibacter subsaxonicus]
MLTRLKSPEAAARWLDEWVTGTLRTDSRAVQPGDAFIAWPGYANDGRQYVAQALAAGATTCVVEAEGVEAFGFTDARVAALPRLKAATGAIANAFYGRSGERLRMVATTGTNGKTSTAWWTAQALTLLGQRCGVIGTLGVGQPPLGANEAQIEFTGLTTPDPVTLHAALRRFADEGYAACAMEASSIGIVEHRLDATQVEVALFTNFTRDHLDYHGTMEAYWAAKRQLFAWPGLKAAVVNLDDGQGAQLAKELAGALELWTYAVGGAAARLSAHDVGYTSEGLKFTLRERDGGEAVVRTTLIGDYNVSNLLAVIGGLRALGVPLADAAALCPQLTAVPGRMQRVGGGQGEPLAVVDYAHTPDALEKVLAALRSLSHARGGRLLCVFGCGGNRDASKRPLMGAIAERLADAVIVTSDNPRREAPGAILEQIAAGLQKPQSAQIVEDRRDAIARTLAGADARDVVLIAGKGHEDYQEIEGVKHPFSDVAEALTALARRRTA